MPNYQLGKIYKLVCDENDDVYVGSTAQPYLSNRFAGHKSAYKCYQKGKGGFKSAFIMLQHPTVRIELIEHYPCDSHYELLAREGYWVKNTACVNKNVCIAP